MVYITRRVRQIPINRARSCPDHQRSSHDSLIQWGESALEGGKGKCSGFHQLQPSCGRAPGKDEGCEGEAISTLKGKLVVTVIFNFDIHRSTMSPTLIFPSLSLCVLMTTLGIRSDLSVHRR